MTESNFPMKKKNKLLKKKEEENEFIKFNNKKLN